MMMTGFCIVVLGLLTLFFMDNADPNREFFPWVHELAVLMFWSGAAMMVLGALVFVWRLFA